MAEGRAPTSGLRRGARSEREPAREGALPPRVLAAEGEGEAVLPLRGREGLAHGVRSSLLVDHHACRSMFGAELGPEGGPDDDHLRAAAGVVLLLPLRAAARDQAGGADAARDDRRPDDLHDPAVPAAVHRPQPGAPPRAAADRDDRGHLRRSCAMALPDLPGRGGRLAERDRHARSPQQYEAGQARRRAVRLPRVPQDRRERQRRARPEPDRHRRRSCRKAAILRTLENPTAPMPSFAGLPEEKKDRAGRLPLASCDGE